MADSDPPLRLHGVSKAFGGVRAIDGVSMVFEPGKVTSLIGPNGAGKTTLFNLIGAFLRPDEGAIEYGRRIDTLDPRAIAGLGIGRLFQDVRLFPRLTVDDNLRVSHRGHPGEDPVNVLLRPRAVARAEAESAREAERWLAFLGLGHTRARLAEELSYGEQKLLAIGRLLAGGFRVLLLDEPAAGVNPIMLRTLLPLLRRLAALGHTVVLVEHNMTVVVEVSDWIYFMDHGAVVAAGTAHDVLDHPRVREAYLGV